MYTLYHSVALRYWRHFPLNRGIWELLRRRPMPEGRPLGWRRSWAVFARIRRVRTGACTVRLSMSPVRQAQTKQNKPARCYGSASGRVLASRAKRGRTGFSKWRRAGFKLRCLRQRTHPADSYRHRRIVAPAKQMLRLEGRDHSLIWASFWLSEFFAFVFKKFGTGKPARPLHRKMNIEEQISRSQCKMSS